MKIKPDRIKNPLLSKSQLPGRKTLKNKNESTWIVTRIPHSYLWLGAFVMIQICLFIGANEIGGLIRDAKTQEPFLFGFLNLSTFFLGLYPLMVGTNVGQKGIKPVLWLGVVILANWIYFFVILLNW
ncbi:hypothetical protein A3B57_01895 [Microgenomates group bacterium RIFCSPLOWO2_01_FULL_47_10]|nr:MAG: hypothetical protein A3B57_01895 [Microgenomates group bacterium RIFCSPLOWO2_01_FULL_47_10]